MVRLWSTIKKGKLWLSIFGEIIQTCRRASLQFLALVSSRREPTVLESTLNSIFKKRTHKRNVCDQSWNRKDMFAITVATVRNALIVSSHLDVKQFRLLAIFR